MFRNFIKTAWRNISSHPTYSAINIFGLSIGIASALLMILFATHEWSYDKFHEKSDQTYRVWVKEFVEGHTHFNTVTPIVVGDALRTSFPQIEKTTRVMNNNYLIRSDGEESASEAVLFVDPEFLRVFDYKILHGQPTFDEPSEIVITESEAERHFGRINVVGEQLEVNMNSEWQPKTVAAVLGDAPQNSSLQFTYMLPYILYDQGLSENARACWTCVFGETYVQLTDGATIQELIKATTPYFDEAVKDIYPAGDYQVGYQRLDELHLADDLPQGIARVSDGRYPYIMLGIAVLILLLAAINYVNLAVARSLTRRKEVGIRKVVGAGQMQIIAQHCSEAILLTLVASGVGLLLAKALLPQFNLLFGQVLSLVVSPALILSLVGGSIGLGILAAVYPAAVLSRFRPLEILSQQVGTSLGNRQLLLRSLVGFQFFLSVGLLIAALAIRKQADYLTSKNLGFYESATMVIPLASSGSFSEDIAMGKMLADQMRNETQGAYVQQTSWSNHAFGTPGWMRLGFREDGTDVFRTFHLNGMDPTFVSAYQLDIIEGSNYEDATAEVGNTVLVNQTFIEEFGIADPVGATLPGPFQEFRIRGVLADFHFETLHEEIEPLVMTTDPLAVARVSPDFVTFDSPVPKLSVRLAGDDVPKGIETVRAFWRDHVAGIPFDFSFVEQDLDNMYQSESRLNGIASAGTMLAMVIAALGIFGISGIALNRRRKELGIRKVLGATGSQLIGLLFKDFGLVLIIAIVAAIPVTGWLLSRWLQDFAYHTNIGVGIYLLACFLLVMVCTIAILGQGLKVGSIDPVETIRED